MPLRNLFRRDEAGRATELAELRPVVLMGRGHSGTRVLAWVCSHLGVCLGTGDGLATGDADDRDFTDAVKRLSLKSLAERCIGQIEPRIQHDFNKAAHGYWQRLGAPEHLWGWKFPETYLLGSYVEGAFPRALYLHLVRDGRDIAFKEHLTDNQRRKLGRRILALQGALDRPRHIQAALSWSYQVERFQEFKSSLPEDKVLEVRFEDLCLHPEDTAAQLCRFLGVEMTAACHAYLKESINTGKVSQYRENDPALVNEVQACIGDTLRRYGYL